MAKFLFVTDLDYTLVGDDVALENLNRWLSEQRRTYGTVICYATGRSLPLYQQLIAEKELLEPDILVLAVGTEIYYQGSYTPDTDWTAKLLEGWNRQQVVEVGRQFPTFVLQPPVEQTPLKVSYYTKPDDLYSLLPQLETILKSQGLAIQMVDCAAGTYLDILPHRANKGLAVLFLQQRLGFTGDRTIICGDSGNDLSMFQSVPSCGIIVGNAQPEVLEWHNNSLPGKRYLAKSDFAAGILEGLEYFGFLSCHQGVTYAGSSAVSGKSMTNPATGKI
ncbi:sucrose-phosphate phosphatase [Microcoleus sp. S28C3]|uniref:sucrose-phosphate phosphatase n=1 Tax=Microcoleus sp. S28C3 TaxID=3055414 RepID=UPI002FD2D641